MPIWIYRAVLAALLIVSSVVSLNVIWALVDLLLGFIVFINIFAMLYLSKYVKYVYDNYFSQVKRGIAKPVWNYDVDIMKVDLGDVENVREKE